MKRFYLTLLLMTGLTACDSASDTASIPEMCKTNADCVSFCETNAAPDAIAACDSAKQCVCIDISNHTTNSSDIQALSQKLDELSKQVDELLGNSGSSNGNENGSSSDIQALSQKLDELEKSLNKLLEEASTPDIPDDNAQNIQTITQQIDELKLKIETILDLQYPLPDYYTSYMDGKIKEINAAITADTFPFVFITDLHFFSNPRNSLPLLREITKHTPVRTIISGGDYVYAYGNDAGSTTGNEAELNSAKTSLLQYASALYPNWFSLRGNHDFTVRTSKTDTSGITWDDSLTKELLIGSSAQWRLEFPEPEVDFREGNVKENYTWQLTDDASRVRIIGFGDFSSTDTTTSWGVSGSRSNKMANYLAQLLKNSDGYTILIATHGPISSALELYGTTPDTYPETKTTNFMSVVEAYVNRTKVTVGSYTTDFTKSTGILAACLSGHEHEDRSISTNGVLYIGTTSDAPYKDDKDSAGNLLVQRERGTITEQAFDVVLLDLKAKKLKTVRIGAGHKDGNGNVINREFDIPNSPQLQ